jgi:DNA polymerase-3 subunit epsilon
MNDITVSTKTNYPKQSMILFFDTETTGKADFNRSPHDDGQPDLRQLAFQIYTVDGKRPLHTFCTIIKPYGIPCSKEAEDKHGISDIVAEAVGVKVDWALRCFLSMATRASHIVAHNIKFDLLVIERAIFKQRLEGSIQCVPFCTMEAMTPVCKLPSPWGTRKFKWPTLAETYFHVTNQKLENAHDALVDVKACKVVFDYLSCNKLTPMPSNVNT